MPLQLAIEFAAAQKAIDALINSVQQGVSEFQKMESQLISISRVTGLAGQELETLSDNMRSLAQSTGASYNQLLALSQVAGQLGVQKNQIAGFVETINKVSVALELSGQSAATEFDRLRRLFKLQQDDILGLANAINAISDSSNLAVQQVLGLAGYMAPVGAQFKFTAQQTLSLGAVLGELGISAGVASTAMQKTLARMSQDTANFARVMGVSVKELKKLLDEDAFGAIQRFSRALGMMTAAEQQAALGALKISDVRSIRVLTVLGQNVERLAEFQRLANEEFLTGNSVNEEYGKGLTSLTTQMGRMSANFQTIISKGFEPFAEFVRETLSELNYWLDENSATFIKWGNTVSDILKRASSFAEEWIARARLAFHGDITGDQEALMDAYLDLERVLLRQSEQYQQLAERSSEAWENSSKRIRSAIDSAVPEERFRQQLDTFQLISNAQSDLAIALIRTEREGYEASVALQSVDEALKETGDNSLVAAGEMDSLVDAFSALSARGGAFAKSGFIEVTNQWLADLKTGSPEAAKSLDRLTESFEVIASVFPESQRRKLLLDIDVSSVEAAEKTAKLFADQLSTLAAMAQRDNVAMRQLQQVMYEFDTSGIVAEMIGAMRSLEDFRKELRLSFDEAQELRVRMAQVGLTPATLLQGTIAESLREGERITNENLNSFLTSIDNAVRKLDIQTIKRIAIEFGAVLDTDSLSTTASVMRDFIAQLNREAEADPIKVQASLDQQSKFVDLMSRTSAIANKQLAAQEKSVEGQRDKVKELKNEVAELERYIDRYKDVESANKAVELMKKRINLVNKEIEANEKKITNEIKKQADEAKKREREERLRLQRVRDFEARARTELERSQLAPEEDIARRRLQFEQQIETIRRNLANMLRDEKLTVDQIARLRTASAQQELALLNRMTREVKDQGRQFKQNIENAQKAISQQREDTSSFLEGRRRQLDQNFVRNQIKSISDAYFNELRRPEGKSEEQIREMANVFQAEMGDAIQSAQKDIDLLYEEAENLRREYAQRLQEAIAGGATYGEQQEIIAEGMDQIREVETRAREYEQFTQNAQQTIKEQTDRFNQLAQIAQEAHKKFIETQEKAVEAAKANMEQAAVLAGHLRDLIREATQRSDLARQQRQAEVEDARRRLEATKTEAQKSAQADKLDIQRAEVEEQSAVGRQDISQQFSRLFEDSLNKSKQALDHLTDSSRIYAESQEKTTDTLTRTEQRLLSIITAFQERDITATQWAAAAQRAEQRGGAFSGNLARELDIPARQAVDIQRQFAEVISNVGLEYDQAVEALANEAESSAIQVKAEVQKIMEETALSTGKTFNGIAESLAKSGQEMVEAYRKQAEEMALKLQVPIPDELNQSLKRLSERYQRLSTERIAQELKEEERKRALDVTTLTSEQKKELEEQPLTLEQQEEVFNRVTAAMEEVNREEMRTREGIAQLQTKVNSDVEIASKNLQEATDKQRQNEEKFAEAVNKFETIIARGGGEEQPRTVTEPTETRYTPARGQEAPESVTTNISKAADQIQQTASIQKDTAAKISQQVSESIAARQAEPELARQHEAPPREQVTRLLTPEQIEAESQAAEQSMAEYMRRRSDEVIARVTARAAEAGEGQPVDPGALYEYDELAGQLKPKTEDANDRLRMLADQAVEAVAALSEGTETMNSNLEVANQQAEDVKARAQEYVDTIKQSAQEATEGGALGTVSEKLQEQADSAEENAEEIKDQVGEVEGALDSLGESQDSYTGAVSDFAQTAVDKMNNLAATLSEAQAELDALRSQVAAATADDGASAGDLT